MAARSFLWSRALSGTCSETWPWATFGTFCPSLATLRPPLRLLSTGSLRAMDWRSRSYSTKRSFRRSTSRRGTPRQSKSWRQALRSQNSSANTASPHGSSSNWRASAWRAARLAPACTRWRTWAWLRRWIESPGDSCWWPGPGMASPLRRRWRKRRNPSMWRVRAIARSSVERKSTMTDRIRAFDSRTCCTLGDQRSSTSLTAGRSILRLCCPCSWNSLLAALASERLVWAMAICCHASLLPGSPSCFLLR